MMLQNAPTWPQHGLRWPQDGPKTQWHELIATCLQSSSTSIGPAWRTSSASAEQQAPLIAIMDNLKRETIMDNQRAISRKSWSHVGTSAPSLSILASSIGASSMNNSNRDSSKKEQMNTWTNMGRWTDKTCIFPYVCNHFDSSHEAILEYLGPSWNELEAIKMARWPQHRSKIYKKVQESTKKHILVHHDAVNTQILMFPGVLNNF